MKEKLKYLIALFLAGSILTGVMPVFSINSINLSVMDILKIGLGFYKGSEEMELIYGTVRTYMEPYAWCIVVALAIILIESFLTVILSSKKAYIISLLSCIINCTVIVALVVIIRIELNEVQSALILLEAADIIQFRILPLFIWGIIYFMVLILSIVGIYMWGTADKKTAISEEIYLDQIRMLEKGNHIPMSTGERNAASDRSLSQRVKTAIPPACPVQQTGAPEMDYCSEQKKEKGETDISEKLIFNGNIGRDFTGAIAGKSGIYKGKVYFLIDMKEIFFCIADDKIVLSPYEEDDNLAGIFFVSAYNEYCIEPNARRFVFLKSGQPLGEGRQYFLPRGTEVYLKDKNNQFTLA